VTIETQIDTCLHAAAAVTALAGARIYALQAPPQTPAPYIIWQVVDGAPEPTHDDGAGLVTATVQVNCFALGYDEAADLAAAALAALLAGDIGQGVTLQRAPRDSHETLIGLYRRDFDIAVGHAFPL